MAARGAWKTARRSSTKWVTKKSDAIHTRRRPCRRILEGYGPGQCTDYRRRRGWLRDRRGALQALAGRIPRREKSQIRHGHEFAQQWRDSLRHLLSDQLAEGAALRRRQSANQGVLRETQRTASHYRHAGGGQGNGRRTGPAGAEEKR